MRLIFFIISFIVLLLVGAVIAPNFVDWNKYKPEIIQQIKSASGLDVQINGDLSLAVLPSPRVKIQDVIVAAPLKKNFDNLLSMKSAEVSVELMPLFSKQIKVQSVALIAPDIQIEILQDGTPSWTTDKLSTAQKVKDVAEEAVDKEVIVNANSNFMDSIALDKFEIEDGKLQFIDHQTGASHSAKDVDVVLKANSLKGPFEVNGSLIYQDKKIAIDAKTGKLPKGDEGLSLEGAFSLPDADTSLNFKGITSIKEPYEVQGQTSLKIGSPAKLAQVTGVSLGAYNKSISLDGLLSANEDKVSFDNLKLSLGDFVGDGKITVQNLKSKNPLMVTGEIKSSSLLNIDDFMTSNKKTALIDVKLTKQAHAATTTKTTPASKAFVPQTLTLPMPIDANVKFDLGGLKYQNQVIKGVFLDLDKSGSTTKAIFKALELPGQAKVDANLNIAYGSSSQSSKTGQVTYSDPNVTYAVNGQVDQLAAFFKAFVPEADTSAVTNLYKTAQFNLKGNLTGYTINLKDSVLKLDQMVVGLGGGYQPATAGGRAKAVIDISADTVDFDRIMNAQGKKSDSGSSSAPKSTKEAVKPIQGFSLPLDLTFDVSLQKARINNADLIGLRLQGDLIGNRLNLKTASVNNFAGAMLSAKGQVGNLNELSGLDLNLYAKTDDVGTLANALKVDVSKLPAGVKALEASLAGKGDVNQLNFNANVKALGGQVEATGLAKDLLGTPSYSGLAIGLKHPNLVKAIQIVNPSFKGQAGLNQAIDFYANADINGQEYKLSNMKVNLGPTNFGGNLNINTGANPMSVRGNIAAGKIALDSLLGAKSSGGASSASSGGTSTGSSSGGGKWSTTPIDLSFMKTVDVNVDLKATSISYGVWNFTNPSTDLKIANGQLNINGMKAGVFGGNATLTTEVKSSPVSLSVSSAMNNIDLEALAKALSGSGKLKTSGTVNFDMNVASTGASANALVNALNGKANLNGTDITIKGFDLVKLARGLAVEEKLITSATNLVSGALNGGETKFDTLKGVYDITNGKVLITSMLFDNPEAEIASTGYADLPSWFINVDNTITLKNVEDLKPFVIKIKGSLSNPETLGKNILEDYVTDKLKRKLGKELPNVLGDKTTDKLKSLGVVGEDGNIDLKPENLLNNFINSKKKAAEPAPAVEEPKAEPKVEEQIQQNIESVIEPAPADPAPAPVKEEVAPAPAPTPEPEPKKEASPPTPEQIIENPEEALKGVIEGLF